MLTLMSDSELEILFSTQEGRDQFRQDINDCFEQLLNSLDSIRLSHTNCYKRVLKGLKSYEKEIKSVKPQMKKTV